MFSYECCSIQLICLLPRNYIERQMLEIEGPVMRMLGPSLLVKIYEHYEVRGEL